MKNLIKYLLIILFLFNNISIFSQSIGEIWYCNTKEQNKSIRTYRSEFTTNPKIVNIFIHIVRNSSGTEGLDMGTINNSLSVLRSNFLEHNIFFIELGRNFIDNDIFYYNMDDDKYIQLINTDRHDDAIDIYFLSSTDSYSRASRIPGDALAFGGIYAETSVLSHEIGHCLGLYHTHSGRGCSDFFNCSENINGSNCSECGDLVCDTPADPCLAGKIDKDCNYVGDEDFSPDIDNIMSYAPPSCLSNFTNGQINRIHDFITNDYILQKCCHLIDEISGPSCIVPHELTSTYTIENLPAGASITWSASNSNLQLVSGQGTSTAVFQKNGNDASCVVKADISVWGITIALEKTVCMTLPEKPSKIFGFAYNGKMFISNTYYNFSVNDMSNQGINSYEWEVEGGTIVSGQGTNRIRVLTNNSGSIDRYFHVGITVNNTCGCSPTLLRTGYVKANAPAYKVYPNPANDYVVISFNQQSMREYAEQKGQKAQGCELVVYDGYNQIMYKTRTSEDEIQIDTRNFPAGTYYLHVTYGDKTEKSQLVIE